jgi:hypothetical protein
MTYIGLNTSTRMETPRISEYLAACALFREDTASSEEEAASGSEEEPSSDSEDSAKVARGRKSKLIKAKPDNFSTVTRASVAGKEMATMSASAVAEVNVKLEARFKKVQNKEVKSCVLQEK